MVGNDELKARACYRLNDEKHRDKTGRFLESKNVGFDNPVYAYLKDPQLTDFVLQRNDGKKEKSQHCESWDVEDHRVPIHRLYKRYGTHPDRGLTEEQARKNQEKYGKNRGAPESIVPYCTTILVDNMEYQLDDFWKERIFEVSIKLGKLGERVLGLRFVGLISLIDPPRAAVPAAIAKCKSAGIQVVMITGEHPMTATAIAQAVGIISDGLPKKMVSETTVNVNFKNNNAVLAKTKTRVVVGAELARMTPDELDHLLCIYNDVVFARTSPEQKQLIVEAFKRLGHTYHSRRQLLYAGQTAFLIGLIVSQWANAIACKTRRLSIFQKGMQNSLMNVALVVSPAIACLLIYTPYVNDALNFRPVSFGPWAAAMPFALLIFTYDELRRLAVRRFQGGWVTSEFYR
ncbi:unnamed protein product [Allacma fusca]|uniref:Cation-transporting P-type ATPase C-terminal domain-containing protein n=1 Tax=Allacma fusca TaxID=39272 RepID=A0A8J2KEF4_9HEXA|nr:unnamed protein product [Allacma fusca]